jgi:hypothetical protein
MKNEDIRVYLGEQEEAQRCHLMLRIGGENLAPDALTRIMQLEPTHAWAKGDLNIIKRTKRELRRQMGHWSVSTEDVASKSLQNHCERLLSLLQGREAAIQDLKDSGKYRISISVWWQVGEIGHGSFNLLSTTVAALSKYCDDFEFHFL